MSKTIPEIAKEYLENGVWVVPLHKNDKKPLHANWQATKVNTTEDFDNGANLGVKTGKDSNIVVIDVDIKEGDNRGKAWFENNKDRLGDYLREDSPSGGFHLYFKYPVGVEEVPTKINLFPKVDLLADGGRQVVTWPSIHPSGGQYVFQNGLNVLDVQHEADPLPSWILEEALARSFQPKLTQDGALSKLNHPSDVLAAEEFAQEVKPAVQGEAGDAHTFYVACQLRDLGLTAQKTYEVMEEYFNPRCSPSWSANDLKRKVHGAYKYAKNILGSKSIQVVLSDLEEEKPTSSEPKEQGQEEKPKGAHNLKAPVLSMQRMLNVLDGRLRYSGKDPYLYDAIAKKWVSADDLKVQTLIHSDIKESAPKAFKSLKPRFLTEVEKLLKTELSAEGFDPVPDRWIGASRGRKGDFIALQNGILDIRSGDLHPHSKDWFSFTVLPFSYDPEARCPEFDAFLTSIWDNDEEIKRSLQLWMGYVLLSDMSQQRFGVLIGESRAGKGTLARIIENLIGQDNAVACNIPSFGSEHGLQILLGKRLAIFNDATKAIGINGENATERIISIVGNDPQSINPKNKDMFSVKLPIKLMLVCNEIPGFVNSRDSLTNRMIVFPFYKTFQGREDPGLLERLFKELPGILNWALAGAIAICAGERLSQSAKGADEIEKIKTTLDSVKGFIGDRVQFIGQDEARALRISDPPFITSQDLYDAYKAWCRDCGNHAKAMKRFIGEFNSIKPSFVQETRRRVGKHIHRGYDWVMTIDSLADQFPEISDDDSDDQPPF